MTIRNWIVTVRGRQHEWGFPMRGTDNDAAEWRADGFDVSETVNVIPGWVPAPLVGWWCRVQDVWNWPSRAWREK
jgi:hypothetical protein